MKVNEVSKTLFESIEEELYKVSVDFYNKTARCMIDVRDIKLPRKDIEYLVYELENTGEDREKRTINRKKVREIYNAPIKTAEQELSEITQAYVSLVQTVLLKCITTQEQEILKLQQEIENANNSASKKDNS